MQPLCFTFKRLALLAGRGARAMASLVCLTPQRCDLLLRLYREPQIQRALAFELGVVRSVVSKMVTALEELGLVVRRGLEGDRRLRLVTLTNRAFHLIHVLLDNYVCEESGHTVQLEYEDDVLERFQTSLRNENVGVADISRRDHRDLLWNMHDAISKCDDEDFIGYEVPRPERPEDGVATRHRKERESPSDGKVHGADEARANEHRTAGIPLDAAQRCRRKRSPRPKPASPPPASPPQPRSPPPPAAPAAERSATV